MTITQDLFERLAHLPDPLSNDQNLWMVLGGVT